jgi:hypothetical protein
MQVLVDDREFVPCGAGMTVRDLAHEVTDRASERDPRMILEVRCDGNVVPQEGLEVILESPASQYQRIEFQTGPTRALVCTTINQAIANLEEAARSRGRIADLLEAGQTQPAMESLGALVGAWKQGQQALVICAEILRLELDTLRASGVSVGEVVEEFKKRLTELKQAMETGDVVLLADLLRYDLESPLSSWIAILKHVRAQADAHAATDTRA